MQQLRADVRSAITVVVVCLAYGAFAVAESAAGFASVLYAKPEWIPHGSLVRTLTIVQWIYVFLVASGACVPAWCGLNLWRRHLRRLGTDGCCGAGWCARRLTQGCQILCKVANVIMILSWVVCIGTTLCFINHAARPVCSPPQKYSFLVCIVAVLVVALGYVVEVEVHRWSMLSWPVRPVPLARIRSYSASSGASSGAGSGAACRSAGNASDDGNGVHGPGSYQALRDV